MSTLPINGLDFDDIKKNFIEFLKRDNFFRDYNFNASSISALINILAYNIHYIGYYVKMMLNESYIDSATQRASLLSKAKLNGYLPKSKKSSRAIVQIQLELDLDEEPLSKMILIPRESLFTGANAASDSRSFYILDDVIMYSKPNQTIPNKVVYLSPEIIVYEGVFETLKFKYDTTVNNQRFIIKDKNIDIDTLRVHVYPTLESNTFTDYKFANNIFELSADSQVFFVNTNEDGYYEIFFGNNIFGKTLENGNLIKCHYISTNGESGNGCKRMTYQRPSSGSGVPIATLGTNLTTIVLSTSTGGLEEESIDELRFNIPNHYRTQQRLITDNDYKVFLLSRFRNIDSINVWGGESNIQKTYNTIFISIKPKFGLSLNGTSKKEIELLLKKYSTINKKLQIIDPEYTFININYYVKYKQSETDKSQGEIIRNILAASASYNELFLDRFNSGLSDVDLLTYIKQSVSEIKRIYTTKILNKKQLFQYNSNTEYLINFGNPINVGSLISSEIQYGIHKCVLKDNNGYLYIYEYNSTTPLISTRLGTVNYELGQIKISIPFVFTATTDYKTGGIINFSCVANSPDIETYMNNIIILESEKVIISQIS